MKRKGWYLIAYDIANPRRLSKVYRFLKNEGLAVQKSLFFIQGTECYINEILDHIASIMLLCEDDLRAYPIMNPDKIWTNGPNPLSQVPVLYYETERTKKKQKKNIWRHLLGIGAPGNKKSSK